MKIKSIISKSLLLVLLITNFSYATEAKTDKKVYISQPYKNNISANGFTEIMLSEDGAKPFSKIHFQLSKYNVKVINEAVDLIVTKVQEKIDEEAGIKQTKNNSKVINKFITKDNKYGIYVKTSQKTKFKELWEDKRTKVNIDKELLLLDILIFNYAKTALVINEKFVKSRFKNQLAFWYKQEKSKIAKGDSLRLVIVVKNEELFKVKKSKGSTQLNFNTKSNIDNSDLIK